MPRLYNKKVGIHAIDKRLRKRTEERDAIVWSVDTTNKIVNLKIQGSDTLMVANYHQVLTAVPNYVKPGAAVTVRHRRGNRGYIEVIGTGRAIPTPVGAGGSLPDVNTTDDILTGMAALATSPETLTVRINSGTYRVDNTLYVFAPDTGFVYTMDDPAPLIMGTDDVTMGVQYFTVSIDSAPATPAYGRYDIIVVGPHDNEAHVVKGTAVNLSTTEPTMPTVPANHILIDWVFIKYGDTVITTEMIGGKYADPAPNTIVLNISGTWTNVDDELTWNPSPPPQPYADISITVKDQYGTTINYGGARGRLTSYATFGQVYGSYSGWRSDYAESPHTSSVSFKFERDQSATEYAPTLLYQVTGFESAFVIVLLDALGDPI